MPANHPDRYWHGVALTIEGESLKAGAYVTHGPSLGVAREAILRRNLINETPARYDVRTGLVRNPHAAGVVASRQCDLLVYEPAIDPPLYRMDDFVVVPNNVARFNVEVKSDLDNAEFQKIMNVYDSLIQFGVPCFGYGFEGVTFETFCDYVRGCVTVNRLNLDENQLVINWPHCVAVHSRNYIAVRPTHWPAIPTNVFMCLLDYSKTIAGAPPPHGQATASFFQLYYSLLTTRRLPEEWIKPWFNALPIQDDGKVWITTKGAVNQGAIP